MEFINCVVISAAKFRMNINCMSYQISTNGNYFVLLATLHHHDVTAQYDITTSS